MTAHWAPKQLGRMGLLRVLTHGPHPAPHNPVPFLCQLPQLHLMLDLPRLQRRFNVMQSMLTCLQLIIFCISRMLSKQVAHN